MVLAKRAPSAAQTLFVILQPHLFSTLFNYTGLFHKEISPNNYLILKLKVSCQSWVASIPPWRSLNWEPVKAVNRWPFINLGLGWTLNICVHEIIELEEYAMWPSWRDPACPAHDASPAVSPSASSLVPVPRAKRAKYLISELLHAREILGVIKTKSFLQSPGQFTSMRSSSPLAVGWEPRTPLLQRSLHLRVAARETLQQRLGKNKSPPRVLAAS